MKRRLALSGHLLTKDERNNRSYQGNNYIKSRDCQIGEINEQRKEQMLEQSDAQALGNRKLDAKPEEGSEADLLARARSEQL